MSYEQNSREQQQQQPELGRLVSSLTKQQIHALRRRLGHRAFRFLMKRVGQALLSATKGILGATAPLWVPILCLFFLAYAAYSLIYIVPRMVAEDVKAGVEERVNAFFGFSDEDKEGWEDIFDVYEKVASRWDEGLSEEQKEQVQPYAFPWSILAAVDRVRNDPYIRQRGSGPIMIVDGHEFVVDGVYPPKEFIPLYQAAQREYGVDWPVLAAIHYTESTYSTYPTGRISSAGAMGPMQFMPGTFVGWSHPLIDSGTGRMIQDFDLSSLADIQQYNGYGVDATGNGRADIWNEADAIFSAANYLSSNAYQRSPKSALFQYNRSNEYVEKVLVHAEQIYQMYELRKENEGEELDEYNLDELDITEYTFFDLTKYDHRITPQPEATFEQLRPRFQWKDSEIITTWEEEVCRNRTRRNSKGETERVRVCNWVKKESTEKIQLLTQADTFQGSFEHQYAWQSIPVSGGAKVRNKVIRQELPVGMSVPTEEEWMQPLYERLHFFGVVHDLDIQLVFELIEMYDEHYAESNKRLESFLPGKYPVMEGSNNWLWPTPSTRITSHFGWRDGRNHNGTDVGGLTAGVAGDPIFAMEDGVVEVAAYDSAAGNYVNIRHDNNVVSRYLHLHAMHVRQGQNVKKGDVIGTMGNTGRSYGAHLHFEIRIDGVPHDPLNYFPQLK
ncbi:peptidoglycan DD-metalloendopeptidase family protein [Alkalihalobacillus oceani]|uniref:Peptidoglycan DD-metalloendopeptidase family protein n=1 Tax=Halalkalibacter oceani TaxID=1653776 RepID=A0A9X2DW38_9BACI|nr:peptidoglycan DD-metalloendopeptidase family protein [Halalkalibacter oceani]MCM3716622.1 peptidoglycan DD-metalloendopeptidase family protein [Halalkalibacter oceani]